jgi:hypothetical protein
MCEAIRSVGLVYRPVYSTIVRSVTPNVCAKFLSRINSLSGNEWLGFLWCSRKNIGRSITVGADCVECCGRAKQTARWECADRFAGTFQIPRGSWWCSAHIDEACERDNKIYVIAGRPSVGIKSPNRLSQTAEMNVKMRRCEIRGRDNK